MTAEDGGRQADWQCPNPDCINHSKMVFGSKSFCPKCGCAKDGLIVGGAGGAFESPRAERGMTGGDMPDDWQCPNEQCKNHSRMVFAKRTSCPVCGTARNAKQAGDWQCPNTGCQNHRNTVFASKVSCPKCGAPKPGTQGMFSAPVTGGMGGGCFAGGGRGGGLGMGMRVGGGGGCFGGMGGMGGMSGMSIVGGSVGGGSCSGGPGDWQCPNAECINNQRMVFAKNVSCPKCGSPKPIGMGSMGGMGGMGGIGGMSGSPGDWQCPNVDCINHRRMVFGKNDSCPQCGSTKPSGMGGGGAMRGGIVGMGGGMGGCMGVRGLGGMFGGEKGKARNPGDWMCPSPDCQNSRNGVFAKHDACPKCGSPKPIGCSGGMFMRSSPY